jgi:hypothetical protein
MGCPNRKGCLPDGSKYVKAEKKKDLCYLKIHKIQISFGVLVALIWTEFAGNVNILPPAGVLACIRKSV